ncbi:MAG: phytoene desaturase family protein [Candidatus Methanofastidiosia archaeon]
MIVVGGGIGGLLISSIASRAMEVKLFERSNHIGGRFRNIDYGGFALTTGALHMIPHGSRGPLSGIFSMVDADCQIVDSRPWGTFVLDSREYRFHSIVEFLSFSDKIRTSKLLTEMKYRKGPNISVEELFEKKFSGDTNDMAMRFAKSFLGWSVSRHPCDVSAREFYAIVKNIYKYGGPGVPIGGCSGVINALEGVLNKNDAEILNCKVSKIVVEDGKAMGVETSEGEYFEDSIIISDVGIKKTVEMCPKNVFGKNFLKRINDIPEAGGIKINVSSDDPLVSHSGILFPTNCERVEGINTVTNADPALAPEGKHLTMSHQTLVGKNIKKEIEIGISDLEDVFCGYDFEVLCAQAYFGKNPVNQAAVGWDVEQNLPLEGLYLVGDSAKISGGVEIEGIALGVMKLKDILGI